MQNISKTVPPISGTDSVRERRLKLARTEQTYKRLLTNVNFIIRQPNQQYGAQLTRIPPLGQMQLVAALAGTGLNIEAHNKGVWSAKS